MKSLTTKLDDLPWIRHGFFTRLGGVSEGIFASLNAGPGSADSPEKVSANRTLIAKSLGIPATNLLSLRQTHSNISIPVTAPWTEDKRPEGDAMVTDRPGVGLGILTADCVPILFACRKKRIIGAAHAGWGGALKGIVESTLDAMAKLGATDIRAAIGPCIRAQSYEVREGFEQPFIARDAGSDKFFTPAEKAGHLMFDLPAYVASRLASAGVSTVYDTRQDTLSTEALYFSYRRATLRGENSYGRQLSVITIKEEEQEE